jgi:L-threonylcarbamoyladenylate synthase
LKIVHPDEIESYLSQRVVAPPVAVVARRGRPRDSKVALWQVAPESPDEYARLLYGTLRRLDAAGCRMIVVEALPELPEWAAVRDRLDRAATPEPAGQPTAAGAS